MIARVTARAIALLALATASACGPIAIRETGPAASDQQPVRWSGALGDEPFSRHFSAPPSYPLVTAPISSPTGERLLSDITGGYAIVAFWATWCAPCLTELTDLAALAAATPNSGVRMIAIQSERRTDGVVKKAAAFQADVDPTGALHWWRDASESGREAQRTLRALPVTMLIAPDGVEIGRMVGLKMSKEHSQASIWRNGEARAFLAQLSALGAAPTNRTETAPDGAR